MKSVPRLFDMVCTPPPAPSVLEFPWEHEWESCHGGVVTYYGEIVVPEQLLRQKPIIGRLIGAKGRITNKILQSSGAESLKVLGTNQYFPAEDVAAGSWSGPLRFMSESRTDEERRACRSLVLELLAEVGQELGFIIPQPSCSEMPEEHCVRLPHERAYPPGSMAWRVRPFAAVRPRYFQPLPHQQQKYHPSCLPPQASSIAVVTSSPTSSAADGSAPSVDASSSHESDVDQGAASAEKLAVVDQNVISQQGQPDSCELPGALNGNACSISSTSDHSGPAVHPEPSCSPPCFWIDAMSPVPPLAAITSGDVFLSEPLEEETPSSDEDLSSKAEDAGGVNEAPGLDNLLDSPDIQKSSSQMENVEACPSTQGEGGFETCEQPAAVLESVTTVKFPHAEGNHPVIQKSSSSPPAEEDMKSQMILERLDGLLVGMAKHWINIAELTPVMKKPEEGLLDFNDEMRAALAQEVLVANRNQLKNVQMMLESILAYSSKISSSVVAEDIEKALSTIQEKLRELNKAF